MTASAFETWKAPLIRKRSRSQQTAKLLWRVDLASASLCAARMVSVCGALRVNNTTTSKTRARSQSTTKKACISSQCTQVEVFTLEATHVRSLAEDEIFGPVGLALSNGHVAVHRTTTTAFRFACSLAVSLTFVAGV